MRRRRAHRAHFPKLDRESPLGTLPGRFTASQSPANNFDTALHPTSARLFVKCKSLRFPGRNGPVSSLNLDFGILGNATQCLAFKCHYLALVEKRSPKSFVELNRRPIPIENLPAHAKAIFFDGQLCYRREQRLADAMAADLF